jgi:hypothetical protein
MNNNLEENMKIALSFLLIFSIGTVLFSQQRYALVIGNNNYTNIKKLDNPVNDATDIAAKLRTFDYQVDLQTNVTNATMARSITSFIQRLAQNRDNEGFFWFAGHAVQMSGENYLLPIDVDSSNEVEAVHSSYNVKRLVDSLDKVARNKVNVVVLDACRDNPFANMPSSFRNVSRGLSVIENLPSDLLIIYSTAAGAVAQDGTGQRNSPFTQAFLQNMDSNEDIQIVFRTIARETMRLTNNNQRPFHDGSFINLNFYSLNPQRTQPIQPVPNKTYSIGDRGPAGGYIFYDKGVYSNGWRYLEASPIEYEITISGFGIGSYSFINANVDKDHDFDSTVLSYTIGTGKKNTEILLNYLNKFNQYGTAIQYCSSLIINNYNDWFLPSIEELWYLILNLKIGKEDKVNFFVSSSPDNITNTWDFSGIFINSDGYGERIGVIYETQCQVRAIRQF